MTPIGLQALANALRPGRAGDGRRPAAGAGLERQGIAALLRSFWRRCLVAGRVRRRILHSGDAGTLLIAYETLTAAEFDALNALQNWTHGRVIPGVVRGLLPAQPALVLDLGCGSGDSTRWLAHSVPPGSQLIGYDFSARRLATARGRRYRHANGDDARVCFRQQRIDAPLADEHGKLFAAGAVDLAFSSGVVGHHLEPPAVARLAAELRRIVRPGAAVVLDAGPRLRLAVLTSILGEQGFVRCRVQRLGPLNPRAQVVFRLPA